MEHESKSIHFELIRSVLSKALNACTKEGLNDKQIVKQKMQSIYPETFFTDAKTTGLICASSVIVMLVLHKWLVVGDNFHSLPAMDSRLHWHEPAT